MNEDQKSELDSIPAEDTTQFMAMLPWGLVILGAVLSLVFFPIKYWIMNDKSTTELSNFGQYASGTAGALFSLAGVILFYLALRIQRKEFELQRIELRKTQQTLDAQRIEMHQQNLHHGVSQLDNKFFNMLSFLLDLKASYKIGNKDGSQHLADTLIGMFDRWQANSLRDEALANHLARTYMAEFSNFFSHLCTIAELVQKSEILDPDQKMQYLKILNGVLKLEEKEAVSIGALARAQYTDREIELYRAIESARSYE